MTYLIAQIWLFIAVAAAIGLLFGWMFRGGVSGARLKELRHNLAHAQAEATEQRREASELAARAERRGGGASAADLAHHQMELRSARDHIARLEARAREAMSAADRYGEEAEELRQRIADLSSRGGGAGSEERAAWRERIGELEQEADSLRRRLETRDIEAGETLRSRIAELEGETEQLHERVASLQDRDAPLSTVTGEDGSRERVEALRREAEELRRHRDETLSAAEQRARRIDELEAESEALRARVEVMERDVGDPLRARVTELEAALDAASAAQPPAQENRSDVGAAFAALEEITTLRVESDQLRAELSARTADLDELARMRSRIGELEGEVRAARQAAESAPRAVAAANGMEELQTESARLKWRNSYLATRIHFLESRSKGGERSEVEIPEGDGSESGTLAAARAEIARLEAKVVDLEKATMPDKSGQPAPNVEQGGGSLEWRNRYLASRVRYLEQQLEQRVAGMPAASDNDLRFKLAEQEEKLKEITKLRARVSELERDGGANGVNGDEDAASKAENQRALEWRIRYLSSRVKYLEDRLAKSGTPMEPSEAP